MNQVHVDLAEDSYTIFIQEKLLQQAGNLLIQQQLKPQKIAILSDSNVAPLHANSLIESLEQAGFHNTTLHLVPAGEASKSMHQVETICREMVQAGHDRQSLVIALGGGVIGDLAGFVAAIFLRGIPFVQIPTTIVSQVDSSVGGKTGVNIPEGKNLLGAFHQPQLVIIDPLVLHTLPQREFAEGFAEAIKHAAIRDESMLHALHLINPISRSVPSELITANIAIKARIVEADVAETKEIRALLNFGHTIGHGIEAAVPYGEMLHGEAISLGMRAALWLSIEHSGLSQASADKIITLLEQFHLPLVLNASIPTKTILEKLACDKKFQAGSIRFVLLREIGDAFVSKCITLEHIHQAIEAIRKPIL